MGIIVILASILTVATSHMYRTALDTRTKATITILALGAEDFKKTYGSYPYHDPAADTATPKRLSGPLANTETNYDIRNLYFLLVDCGCIKSNALDPKYLSDTLSATMTPDQTALDAWGEPLTYRYPRAQRGSDTSSVYETFDLWSKGPDGADSRSVPTDTIDPTSENEHNGDNLCWPFEEKR